MALVSANYAGIAPIVGAGLAVTVLPLSAIRVDHRALRADEGLPDLPPCRIGILKNAFEPSCEAMALAEEIRSTLASQSGSRDERDLTASERQPMRTVR